MPETVLITGGSVALGRALVRRFREEGWQTAFTYMKNEEVAKELELETEAAALRADLTNSTEARRAVEEAVSRFGAIDALVNAAGSTQVMPFALIEEEDWDEMMSANLKTMFLVTREAARSMIANRSGSIVNIGSIAGQRLMEVPVHYATAKAGVCGFTIGLAAELQRWGIRVNCVIPGMLDGGVAANVPREQMEEYLSHCSARRPGRMEEVADLVLFLAGGRSSYINAQSISINGGI